MLGGFPLFVICYSGISLVVRLNLTCFFGVALSALIILEMGEVVAVWS